MAGYGRGYYGGAQLETPARGRSWATTAIVLAVGGAAAWALWARASASARSTDGGNGDGSARKPERPPAPIATWAKSPAEPPEPTGALAKQLEDDAHARGFVTVKDYEDSVVASAKGIQETGAKVELPENLKHLASRIQPKSSRRSDAAIEARDSERKTERGSKGKRR